MAPTARARFAFPDAGYFGRRDPGGLLVIDCGRLAPDALPAHGHGDLLSFEWSVGGRRIVVDQGVHEYVAGPRRQASRSAASHNTPCLDGADQADFFGAFRFGRRPTPRLVRFAEAGEATLFEGSHDGFSHLPGRPRPVRRITATADRLEIVDRIEGRPRVGATIGVLLHPDVAVSAVAGGFGLAAGGVRITLTVAGGTVAVEPAAWWPDMGVEEPTRRIRIRVEPGRAEVISTFTVHEAGGAEAT